MLPKFSRDEFAEQFGDVVDETFARVEAALPRFHSEIRCGLERVKILCLSEVNDNILMWSHYADRHTGVCLKLKCVPEEDSPWGVAVPIVYSKYMPRLLDEEKFARIISGQESLDDREMTRRLVYTKADDWAYEKEWRIFAGDGRTPAKYEDLLFGKNELDAIYFGCRMSDDDKREFASLVRTLYPRALMFEAVKSERTFALEFRSVR